jgi:D-alanyl-D-alanine dipeptidase
MRATTSLRVGALTAAFVSLGSCAQAVRTAVAPPSSPIDSARQLVVIVSPDWSSTTASMRLFARAATGQPWSPDGPAASVVLGRTGLAWADSTLASSAGQPVKHEGDGKSPAGAFALDTAFGFSSSSDMAWVRLPYVTLRPGSDCVDDDASVHYNTIVDRTTVPRIDWQSAEHMRQIPQYRIGVIVGYNANPPRKGRGSCIFLHIWGGPNSVTAGCSALDEAQLELLMRWLDRAKRPMLVQLPAGDYARLRSSWALPPL